MSILSSIQIVLLHLEDIFNVLHKHDHRDYMFGIFRTLIVFLIYLLEYLAICIQNSIYNMLEALCCL